MRKCPHYAFPRQVGLGQPDDLGGKRQRPAREDTQAGFESHADWACRRQVRARAQLEEAAKGTRRCVGMRLGSIWRISRPGGRPAASESAPGGGWIPRARAP